MEGRLAMSLSDIIKEKKLTPKQKAASEKVRAEKAAAAQRKAEKEKVKAENRVVYLAKQEELIKESIAKLRREVSLQFDVQSILPTLETQMQKYGKIESFRKSPVGVSVRYESANAAQKAVKGKKIEVRLPVPVFPAEIKHHAVYFNAPEQMGDLDDEILSQIKSAMGSHGTVVSCKKKGRSVVIFFDDKETRDGLISVEGDAEVTVEIGDHAVALHPGLPPNIRKRRKAQQLAKKKAKAAEELAIASGQPPPPKMIKSE